MVALHSLPGCGRQQYHFDYYPELVTLSVVKPIGVLIALQDDTHIVVLEHGKVRKIYLKRGQIFVFDGDTLHEAEHTDKKIYGYIFTWMFSTCLALITKHIW